MNATGEQWVLESDGRYRCLRHPNLPRWDRGEVCHACTSDPGEPVNAISQMLDDTVARTAEAEIESAAKTCLRIATDLEDDGTAIDKNLAVKYRESYLKHMRLWREMRTERLNVQRDAELIKHDREMSGLRGPH